MNQKAEQKQRSYEAILASASSLLRERGIRGSSVMDVMKGAGLTVGGFYGHFDSKEHLFTETIRSAAQAMWKGLLVTAKGDTPEEKAVSVIRRYLSRKHRDHPELGCPLPSTAPEVAREGDPYRGALEGELVEFVKLFSDLLEPDEARHEKALAVIAMMYGALSLSRAVGGSQLSDEFLRAARKFGEALVKNEAT